MWQLFRTPRFEDPVLGRYKLNRTTWVPEDARAGLTVSMEGEKEGPSPQVVALARQLLEKQQHQIQAAKSFLQADATAREFMQGNGELVCDGFTVYASGAFAVEFSLSEWPDAMISVPFEAGVPSRVLLAD